MELKTDNKRLLFVVLYLIGMVVSGAAFSTWAVSMGDSTRYIARIWVSICFLELFLFIDSVPHHRQDWIAHIFGIGIAVLLTIAWIILNDHYPMLFNPNIQLLYGILTILSQAGIIYILSSREYRKVFRK